MRNAGIAYNPSAEERAEDEAWLAERWAEKHPYDPTIPTPGGVASWRNTFELEMFRNPERAEWYLEVLALADVQTADDTDAVKSQRFGGHRVLSLDRLLSQDDRAGTEYEYEDPDSRAGVWGTTLRDVNRPRSLGREKYLDALTAFFETAISRVQPKPRQNMDRFHDALREVMLDRRSVREVGKAEGVGHDAVVHRRRRAVEQLAQSINPDGLDGIARELVWFMRVNNVNVAHLPEWVRLRAERKVEQWPSSK